MTFDATGRGESVQNLVWRYRDLETCFPEELRGESLPYFVDWLLENVHLVEITAYSDDDVRLGRWQALPLWEKSHANSNCITSKSA